jgi:hypothetical protein
VSLVVLLKAAGDEHLGRLGLRQQGRSRTWVDDHDWWLGVVEFQPSSWSKGSYLHVGAMWLWDDVDHLAFHVGHRVAGFVGYESDEQFAEEADRLGRAAAELVEHLRREFPNPQAAAKYLDSSDTPANHRHAGYAFLLTGKPRAAVRHLRKYVAVEDDREWASRHRADAELMIAVAEDGQRARAEVEARIAETRSRLGLSARSSQ